MTVKILVGDVRTRLLELQPDSVHCIVTSPPYWGLRDYGTATWEGGAGDCDHKITRLHADPKNPSAPTQNGRPRKGEELNRQVCRCGAVRVDAQIGLESSPADFIAVMVDIFEELRRVLRPDGTCWVNMGDSYAGSWGAQGRPNRTGEMAGRAVSNARAIAAAPQFRNNTGTRGREFGLKPKDLVMMPHRLAIALQDAGWWVRQDIVWSKPNPMPESVRDRCTKAHEYIFLLTKGETYYFDQDAIAEPLAESSLARLSQNVDAQMGSARVPGKTNGTMKAVSRGGLERIDPDASARMGRGPGWREKAQPETRNKRSVWTLATQPYKEAHFATFPPELPEICIKAGCPPGGLVLDPFFGAGTTGLVADRLQRDCIGIELNPVYAEIARKRIQSESSLFAEIEVAA